MAVHVQEGLFDLQIIAQKLKKLHNSGASVEKRPLRLVILLSIF